MSDHDRFTIDTGILVYLLIGFSWEEDTNENTNGLVRQYFPKGMILEEISTETIPQVQGKLMGRP
jgi:IS30 family transposase